MWSLDKTVVPPYEPAAPSKQALHHYDLHSPAVLCRDGMNGGAMEDVEARLESLPLIGGKVDGWNLRGSFAASIGGLAAVLIALFSIFVEYTTKAATDKAVLQHYTW